MTRSPVDMRPGLWPKRTPLAVTVMSPSLTTIVAAGMVVVLSGWLALPPNYRRHLVSCQSLYGSRGFRDGSSLTVHAGLSPDARRAHLRPGCEGLRPGTPPPDLLRRPASVRLRRPARGLAAAARAAAPLRSPHHRPRGAGGPGRRGCRLPHRAEPAHRGAAHRARRQRVPLLADRHRALGGGHTGTS